MPSPQAALLHYALTPTVLNFLQKVYKSLYDATKSPTDTGQSPIPAETGLPNGGGGGSGDINVIQDGSADDGEGEVAPLIFQSLTSQYLKNRIPLYILKFRLC